MGSVMTNNDYKLITGDDNAPNNSEINHITINYVDDSTSILSSNNHEHLQIYCEQYYNLLKNYYNINYLKINADKTKFMLICKPRNRHKIDKTVIKCDSFNIEQVNKIKILGMYIMNTLDQTPNINTIIQKVNFRSIVFANITKYASYKTRKILYESIILSVFRYCCENLIDEKARHINVLNVLFNKCAHRVIGFRSYKMTTSSILKELNWLSASQLIISHSLKLIHKVSYEMLPPALTQYLYHSMVRSNIARYTRKPSMTHKYLSSKTKNGFFPPFYIYI